MATRQYVGARYTIKVYENTVTPGSAEWQANVTYEPITLVTYNNSSYLSKKQVPASVGNPAANPAYWVVTGNYNGQISYLQSEIDTINDTTIPNVVTDYQNADAGLQSQIDILKNRKFIFIGDSYAGGTYGNTGWIDLAEGFLDLTNDVNAFDARNAGSLTGGSFAAGDFTSQLTVVYNYLSGATGPVDPSEITDICVFAGYNERTHTVTEVAQGINAFCSYAKSHFPNALVSIGFIGRGNDPQYFDVLNQRCYEYIKGAQRNKARYITNIEYVNRLYSDYNADTIHPNDYTDLAAYISEGIINGSVDVQRMRQYNIPITENATSGSVTLVIHQSNNVTEIIAAISGSNVSAINSGGTFGTGVKLADIDLDYVRQTIEIPLPCYLANSVTTFEKADLMLVITKNAVLVRNTAVDSNGFVSTPVATSIANFTLGHITLDTIRY